jgi:hypothetical protein
MQSARCQRTDDLICASFDSAQMPREMWEMRLMSNSHLVNTTTTSDLMPCFVVSLFCSAYH